MTVGLDVLLAHRLGGTSRALARHSRLQIGEQRQFIDFTLPHCLAGAGGAAGCDEEGWGMDWQEKT